jgi:hypothetical protein
MKFYLFLPTSLSSTVTDFVLIYESVTSSASVVRWLTLHSWTLNSTQLNHWTAFWVLFRLNHDWRIAKEERRMPHESEPWVLYYDRRSFGQSLFEWSTHLGLTTRFLLLSDSCGYFDIGRSLWRQDGSVVYNCSWPLPGHSFSCPCPMVLVIIFYSLRFETSIFVTSYDSQGYGGGIRSSLHTGFTNELLVLPLELQEGPNRDHHL